MTPKLERLLRARRLVAAIESEDAVAERELSAAIGGEQSSIPNQELERIVQELRGVLSSVHATAEVALRASRELPDAQLRLHHVIELTEDAAHRTLTAVEDSLPLADGISLAIGRFIESRAEGNGDEGSGPDLTMLLKGVVHDVAQLRSGLSDVLLAQSFQDITGQIIRRVAGVVAELEGLAARLASAGGERGPEPLLAPAAGDDRPAALQPAPAQGGTVQRQCDVDDLLAELGV